MQHKRINKKVKYRAIKSPTEFTVRRTQKQQCNNPRTILKIQQFTKHLKIKAQENRSPALLQLEANRRIQHARCHYAVTKEHH